VPRGKSARLTRPVGKVTAAKIAGLGLLECDPPERVKPVEADPGPAPDVGAGLVPALTEDAVNGPVASSSMRSDEQTEEVGPPPLKSPKKKKAAPRT
jgi:hypothetical protein